MAHLPDAWAKGHHHPRDGRMVSAAAREIPRLPDA